MQPGTWKRKACMACARAKRQCNKASPVCRRCRETGSVCTYPVMRQDSLSYIEPREDAVPNVGAPVQVAHAQMTIGNDGDFQFTPSGVGAAESSLCLSPSSVDKSSSLAFGSWFMSPETWSLKGPPPNWNSISRFDAQSARQTAKVQSQGWLKEWITAGQMPYIHRQLYRDRMPRCMQDAYTAAVAYTAKTEETEEMIFQIIDDRAAQLVQDRDVSSSLGPLDTLDHLAYVQALTVYQSIRLFDGDITMRSRAEQSIQTLHDWSIQMYQTAAAELGSLREGPTAVYLRGTSADSLSFVWKLWIVAESIRRTWLTAKTLQGIYNVLKDGWTECPGSTFFTARKGMWEAKSAYSWLQAGTMGQLFMHAVSADCLFLEAKPGDIDEFSYSNLAMTFGLDAVERWVNESKSTEA